MNSVAKLCPNCRKLPASKGGVVGKFCNSSCAASYNNSKFPKRKPEGRCKRCGKPTRSGLSYCTVTCRKRAAGVRRKQRKIDRGGMSTAVIGVMARRRRTKIKAVEYKGGKCEFCGYNRCLMALDFHHRDPSIKEFSISRVTASWKRVKKELDKCVLACATCHREIHAGLIDINKPRVPPG